MAPPTSAADSKRVAFVVGIETYGNLSADKQLTNSLNDAEGVSAKLTEIGFQVVTALNLTRSAFNEKWQNILNSLSDQDTLVLYFSGHGIQIGGQNYLLPSDIPYIQYGRDDQLKRESISLNEILTDLSTGDRPHPKNSIVILDACRDNPLIPPGYKGASTIRGLADPPQPEGIFVLYAAASNQTALERLFSTDPARYSVFTRTLLPLIERTDLSILELSSELKDKVRALAKSAGHEQRPTYYDGTVGRFCLPGCVEGPAAKRLRDQVISQRLSAEARNHLDKQLDLALLLSVEAYKRDKKTTEALQSLYTSLDSAGSTIFLPGHPDDGSQLTFSEDNKLLAAGSQWGWVQIWDMNSTPPRPIRLPGHGERIMNLAVSPTNQAIATNDEKGNVALWDLSKTPPQPRDLLHHRENGGIWLTFNSDGSILAAGDSNGNVTLWTFNSSAGEVHRLAGHTSPILKLMFTPDQKTLITGDYDGTYLLWDLTVMPPTQRRRIVTAEGIVTAKGILKPRAMSPDGKILAIGGANGLLRLWDLTVDHPQPTALPGYEGDMSALAFGPNGKKLIAGDRRGTLLAWDLTVEPPRSTPLSTPAQNMFTHGVHKVAISPNGTTIVATTHAGYGGFHLWDLKSNPLRSTFHGGHQGVVEKLIFSPDSKHLVTADNQGTHLMWHLHDQLPKSRTIPGHRNGVVNIAFTTDGQSIGLVDSLGTFMIWKIDAPSSIQTHLHGSNQANFEQIHFSNDWSKLVAKSGHRPFLWDRTSNPPRSIFIPTPAGGVGSLKLSPDGTRLAVGGRDNITLWNLTSVPPTSVSLPSHGHNEYVWKLGFTTDNKFLASTDGRDVLLWNLKDSSFPKPLRGDHKGRAGNFAFSPDNKYLASGGANGTLVLWDLSTTPLSSNRCLVMQPKKIIT